jgi:hypothetical protein
MTTHKVAVISGDGIGVQLTEAALTVVALGWPEKVPDSVSLLGLLPVPKAFVERG